MEMINVTKSDNYASLEGNVKRKVFGQDVAIQKLVDSILIAKAGLRQANKPIGSLLICRTNWCR